MNVATIIVTYNGHQWIEKTLQTLFNSSISTDIIVIDNCSTDNTRQILKTFVPKITLIESDSNLGFGGANNLGFLHAKPLEYDYLFLLNQDAWIEHNCLEELIKVANIHPELGIISPLHLNGKGNNFDAGFAFYTNLSFQDIDTLQQKESIPVSFVNAALWLIPAKVFNEIGGFDPLFHHYGEDVDWNNRLIFHGYSTAIATKAIGYHDRDDRPSQQGLNMKVQYIAHLVRLKDPNYSLVKAIVLGILAPLKLAVLNPRHLFPFCAISLRLTKLLPKIIRIRKLS